MRKPMAVLLTAVLLCGLSTEAFAAHYHYRGGHYYRNAGWWGLGGFVTGLAVGAYVTSLPPRYETVVIGGAPYYYADGYYYQTGPSGYVVVSPPVVQGQAVPAGNSPMVYVLGTLCAILVLAGTVLVLKKLFAREDGPTRERA